jgi:hypothetical protein
MAREILRLLESPSWIHEICYGQIEPLRCPHGRLVPPTDLVRPCFTEPFGEGLGRTPRDLTPVAQILEAVMRRTLLLRVGYHEELTRIQLWLVHHLVSHTIFDIWDVMLSEMEDTLAEGFRGHRQLPYAHWITFLIRWVFSQMIPETLAELNGATIEFP